MKESLTRRHRRGIKKKKKKERKKRKEKKNTLRLADCANRRGKTTVEGLLETLSGTPLRQRHRRYAAVTTIVGVGPAA